MILADKIFLSYDKKHNIIENGNFNIKNGEFVFISGSSGSGKSTLLKSLYGEIPLQSGTLLVNKTDLRNIKSKQ